MGDGGWRMAGGGRGRSGAGLSSDGSCGLGRGAFRSSQARCDCSRQASVCERVRRMLGQEVFAVRREVWCRLRPVRRRGQPETKPTWLTLACPVGYTFRVREILPTPTTSSSRSCIRYKALRASDLQDMEWYISP